MNKLGSLFDEEETSVYKLGSEREEGQLMKLPKNILNHTQFELPPVKNVSKNLQKKNIELTTKKKRQKNLENKDKKLKNTTQKGQQH